MNILQVNTYSGGGAGIACHRLNNALLSENVNSVLLVKKGVGNGIVVLPQNDHASRLEKVQHKINFFLKELKLKPRITHSQAAFNKYIKDRQMEGLEYFSSCQGTIDITKAQCFSSADIVNFHWISDFVNIDQFLKKNIKPLAWTLHDLNPFSYGVHYEEHFYGMDSEGIPKLRIVGENEKKHTDLIRKEKLLLFASKPRITFVCLNDWMVNNLRNSELFGDYPTVKIENSVDTKIFRRHQQDFAREVLGIPLNMKVILFVADLTTNNRKGMAYLQKAVEQISNSNTILCSVGNGPNEFANTLSLGSIHDQRLMSLVYSAADVFAIPSLEDNAPNTILESLCCGTPVIGFPVGGIPELVDSTNGILAEKVSVTSLRDAILLFFDKVAHFDRATIEKNAHKRFATSRQALKYISLYNNLL